MEKISLDLPNFEYKTLRYTNMHNVGYESRSKKYEKQNELYRRVGYNSKNSAYKQTFEVSQDINIFASTLFERFTVSVMCQAPGQTLPEHLDTFYSISKNFNVDPNKCCRVNIFLEDWKSGHYFEINENPVLQWKAGDAIIIELDEPHLSGNMGLTNKYTMQVTGVKDEFKRG